MVWDLPICFLYKSNRFELGFWIDLRKPTELHLLCSYIMFSNEVKSYLRTSNYKNCGLLDPKIPNLGIKLHTKNMEIESFTYLLMKKLYLWSCFWTRCTFSLHINVINIQYWWFIYSGHSRRPIISLDVYNYLILYLLEVSLIIFFCSENNGL